MAANREKQKAEAILRMKKIGIPGEAAALFEKENIIRKSLTKSPDYSAFGTAGFEIIPGAEIRYTGRKDLMS